MYTTRWSELLLTDSTMATTVARYGGHAALTARAPSATVDVASAYVPIGLFIAGIEEGARIFTPVRLLPKDHPEAMGHDFPTVEQFHRGEAELLTALGRRAGLLLGMTLQRYPREPDGAWPYAPFRAPPATLFDSASVRSVPAARSPVPGLRAVAYVDSTPIAFIVDTRGLTLAERKMSRTTSSGLDISRAELLSGLQSARLGVVARGIRGAWVLVYERQKSR
jgi:hypothetical protein